MKRFISTLVSFSLLVGCAVGPQQFAEKRYTLRPDELCRAHEAAQKDNNYSFLTDIEQELSNRGISPFECADILKDSNRKAAGVAIAILGILAVAAAAKSGGSGGNNYQPITSSQDHDWAWDQFYNERFDLVWACRGKQTGRFSELSRCDYKSKIDSTWPSKRADGR